MPNNVWDKITYPFPNFNSATVEVREWFSNFIPHFLMDVITYPCWNQCYSMLVKGAPAHQILNSSFSVRLARQVLAHRVNSVFLAQSYLATVLIFAGLYTMTYRIKVRLLTLFCINPSLFCFQPFIYWYFFENILLAQYKTVVNPVHWFTRPWEMQW